MENALAQNSKEVIRKSYLKARRLLTKEEVLEKSMAIVTRFASCSAFASAEKILIYLPIKNEVLADLLINLHPNKMFFLPAIHANTLVARLYTANLTPNQFGILEPTSHKESFDAEIQVVVVPCVGVDVVGNRLGYGGGYYDRYFAKLNKEGLFPFTVGLIYDFQFSHIAFPTQPHDVKLNAVFTEHAAHFFQPV